MCNSCEATAVGALAPALASAARVVLADGKLQRFPGGTRASQAMKAAAAATGGAGAGCFLCIVDALEVGVAVAAVAPDEELHPGQLYFVLPAAMQRRPLQAEEMAALAVRASAALAGDQDDPLVFPDHEILWYIITDCVIMHNMIVENEHEQAMDYYFYDLMGKLVRSQRSIKRIKCFLKVYHDIRDGETHLDLQKDVTEEWWAEVERSCGNSGSWPPFLEDFLTNRLTFLLISCLILEHL